MNPNLEKIILTPGEIEAMVASMARKISADHSGEKTICVGILRGAFVFMADLVRHFEFPVEIEFIRCSSYRDSTVSSKEVHIEFANQPADITGHDVLVIDEILDAGWTLKKVCDELRRRGAKQVRTAVLLDKPARRATDFQADYVGCEIEDLFVVGYGMDYQESYRNLPYIGILKP